MTRFFLTSYLLFSLQIFFGQILIEGKVLEKISAKPIPYANIGISKSNVGTISNENGSFSLLIPQSKVNDTLLFSALGFGKRSIPIQQLLSKKEIVIWLNEKATLLNEIIVHDKAEKNKTFELGNLECKGGVIEFDTAYAGRSNSLLIENNRAQFQKDLQFPVYLDKASLRIFRNNLKTFKIRLRLNEVDSITGAPGKDLLQQSVIVESSIRSGWVEFDLSKLNIVITKPFFLTFEKIHDLADRTAIANGYRDLLQKNPTKVKNDTVVIDGKKEVRQILKGTGLDVPGVFVGIGVSKTVKENFTCYVKETSFSNWNKVRGIVTATVVLSNQKLKEKNSERKTPCGTPAQCETERMSKEFMDNTGLNGIQFAVSNHGKLWTKSLGYADVANRIAVNDSTKFRIASISKSMTSVGLVKLVSEGKLDLDVPVQKYLPQFPEKKYAFTARQLAGHLAGFRDYITMADYVHHEHYDNAIQSLKVFQNDTLLFKPGTKFHYSTFSFRVLGAVIENIAQKNYLDYMKENVFTPLQLRNTCGDNNAVSISNRSKFYDLTGQENEFGDLSYAYAGGGLLSTASDLVKYGQAMLRQKDEMKKLLFTSQKTLDGIETGYGLGWYVGKDRNGHRTWYHSGDGFSCSSHLYIYPDDDLVIAFVANGQEGAAFDIQKVASLFYEK